jgi:GDP-4-dehydro-6-deoxy-D-mannose reductase
MKRAAADRILVTGAGGFLAAALLERLGPRGRVFKLGRSAAPGVRAYDLSSPEAARAAAAEARPRFVYHLAGDARARGWFDLWRAHVTATVNLLEALSARGEPVRVVVVGSSAEYGAAGGARPVREDAATEPVSAYGSSKLAQTLAALSFSRGPVEVVVARVFNALGSGTPEHLAPGAFARQFARVADGLQPPEIIVGELGARRDYLDARDVASALETLMRRGSPGEIYNVGSGRSLPMSAILRGFAAAAGVAARVKIDRELSRPSPVKDLRADARKLRALGWRPRVALPRSLGETVDSFRAKA